MDFFVAESFWLKGRFSEALFAILFVFREVSREERDHALTFKCHDVRADPIEESAVVRDHHGTAAELEQRFFQCPHRVHIQIVGRFV